MIFAYTLSDMTTGVLTLHREHTLHGDAAAIRALALVPRFGVGSFVAGSAPQTAAHVNLVLAERNPPFVRRSAADRALHGLRHQTLLVL